MEEMHKLSYETKTIVTVILLVTVYPLGIFFMFKWMDWPKRVKVLVVLPLVFLLVLPLILFLFILLPMYGGVSKL